MLEISDIVKKTFYMEEVMTTESIEAQTHSDFNIGNALLEKKERLKEINQTPTVPSVNDSSAPKPLEEEAFYGLAGDIVNTIEPHTEADQAALLFQLLTVFGNVVGRNAYFMAEADKHFTNLFCLLVGDTSKGRKGTSWGHIERTIKAIDEDWVNNRRQSGLSSGEGLIWAVRNQIERQEPIREKGGKITEYQTVIIDKGIEDKRLLVNESEFALVLKVLGRDGNTLSAVIRNSWDDGNLSILTKNSAATATDAHISINGHITKDELKRYLNSTEAGNGFANRFLFVYVKRSKILPEGGRIHEVDFSEMSNRLRNAVEFAKGTGEMKRDETARMMWFEVYEQLSEGKEGLFGAVTARAEAQVMRIACIYALLDKSSTIRKEHLAAALAAWEYSETSAKHIFGDSLGDPVADEINRMLLNVPDGMTRTDISNLFGRNIKSHQISRALGALLKQGSTFMLKRKTDGRAEEVWFSVKHRT